VKYGEAEADATSDITAKRETVNLAGGQFETILIDVKLSYTAGGTKPTQRALKFWFSPGKGLVKRELGMSSTREPLPAGVVIEEKKPTEEATKTKSSAREDSEKVKVESGEPSGEVGGGTESARTETSPAEPPKVKGTEPDPAKAKTSGE
jgi:hypothetical protein